MTRTLSGDTARDRPQRAILGLLSLGAACTLLACGGDRSDPTPFDPVFPEPATPAQVLSSLKLAYEQRELGEYERLFSDDFVFVFAPTDVDPIPPLPLDWPRVDEIASARNLFQDDRTEEITLRWSIGELEYDQESRPFVRVSDIHLSVRIRTTAGQRFDYRVPGATAVFYFRERTPAGSTQPEWEITRWLDWPRPLRHPAADSIAPEIEETTWSMLKALCRYPTGKAGA